MTNSKLFLCVGAATLSLTFAGAAFADDQASTTPPASGATPAAAAPASPPAPTPPPYPSMGPTLSNNANSASFDAGPLGKLTVNGVVSAVGFAQSNPLQFGAFHVNGSTGFDLSNGMATVQQDSGIVQFVVQAGVYSFPTVGNSYLKATSQTALTFGYAPVAYVKIVPNSMFSFQIGQLPTLIGAELPFTYQNANIERGLLWNQEPLISRGIQGNFTEGPWTVSLSWNDGYYSNEYTTISGLVTYTFKNSDTLTFAGSGNASTNFTNTCLNDGCVVPFATPLGQQQGQIYNLIFNHTQGKWTFTPYIQYNHVPNDAVTGASGSLWAGALIAKYSFTPEISLAGRVEYEGSSGAFNTTFFGAGSNAWSLALTPTYQKGIFFARIEGSYVSVGNGTLGSMFGSFAEKSNQARGFLETGVIF